MLVKIKNFQDVFSHSSVQMLVDIFQWVGRGVLSFEFTKTAMTSPWEQYFLTCLIKHTSEYNRRLTLVINVTTYLALFLKSCICVRGPLFPLHLLILSGVRYQHTITFKFFYFIFYTTTKLWANCPPLPPPQRKTISTIPPVGFPKS